MTKITAHSNEILDHTLGAASLTFPTNIYVGLSTTYPTVSGSSFSEPSGGAYARATAAFGAASSASASNSSAVAFPASTASWGEILAFGIFYASTGGTAKRRAWLGAETRKYFQPADINTTSDRITLTSHGYANGDSIVLGVATGSTLGAGATADTRYYAKSIDANTIEVYSDSGLTTIVNFTNTGTGTQYIFKINPRNINASGITLSFATGQLTVTES